VDAAAMVTVAVVAAAAIATAADDAVAGRSRRSMGGTLAGSRLSSHMSVV